MQVKIERKELASGYTMGALYINGAYFCDTLEDTDRFLTDAMSADDVMRKKVPGQTAIPIGRYRVRMSYSPRFKRDMPEILRVPGFSGVRIHAGNNARDTEGCILLGKKRAGGYIVDSRKTCNAFEDMLNDAGDVCDLEVCYG